MLHWTALVTVLAILFYFYTGFRIPRARRKYGVPVPAMSGNADFERVVRVQMNTLEWMPIFLPLLWLFAYYVGDRPAAALGLIWVGGRIYYMLSYTEAAAKRGPGFFVQALVCAVLLIGAAARIIASLLHGV
jgi:glutathione S-transferase